MAQLFANNAQGTLNAGINATATSIVLSSGQGAAYPSPTGGDFFKLTLTQAAAETSWEIACIVGRTTDTLTVGIPGSAAADVAGRGYDSTSAATWSGADKAESRLTAADVTNFSIHNATGKATPVDADEVGLWDSVAGVLKKVPWANLKATLGATFAALAGSVSQAFSAASIELGHASDTTLTRSSAGILAVEGVTVPLNGTAQVATFGTVELGHASDTTLSRSAAGVLAVEGVVVPSISSTNTLTNKRVTPRVGSTTSSATPTINTDSYDVYKLTAQTVDITSFTTNLTGTPSDGDVLFILITGTAARAITWGTSFEASTVALPTTTVTTAMLTVGFMWNGVTSKWRCMASA